jgi:N-acetylglucosaminyl-diphospho-decaprenol L-rhamnosyltransferase
MGQPDLAVVIVNWNTVDLLRGCLASICENKESVFEVCVVDNASDDGSAEMVAATFPQVRLIRNSRNTGFSAAANTGMRLFGFGSGGAIPKYVLLCNPDTVVPPSAFSGLTGFLDKRPDAGAAGPRLILPDGTLDLACRRSFPTPASSFYRFSGLSRIFPKSRRFGRYNLTFLDPDTLVEVDCVNGAFMMVRGGVIEKIGLLDEDFFFGGEDLDWAFRIKAAGWKVFYNPAVSVTHIKRAAFRKNPAAAYEFERAMWLFYRKHYRDGTPRWLDYMIRAGLSLRGGIRLIREMRGKQETAVPSDRGGV